MRAPHCSSGEVQPTCNRTRGPLAARAERFNPDRILAGPLLLALQSVAVEFGFVRVRTRPSACAARETREQHHVGKCEQSSHRVFLFRLVALSLRFLPAAPAVWWPADAQRYTTASRTS